MSPSIAVPPTSIGMAQEASLKANQTVVALQKEKSAALEALATRDGEPRQLLKVPILGRLLIALL